MSKWQKLAEHLAYEGRFQRVIVKTFRMPDGDEQEFEVKAEQDAAAVLALTPDLQVLLVRQFRVGVEDALLELPGGGVEEGQSALETATAELLEETGFAGTLKHAGSVVECAYSTRVKHAFVATDCRRVADPSPEPGEFPELVLMALPEFREHLRSGRLTDVNAAYLALDALGLL